MVSNSGGGKTEFVCEFLAEHKKFSVAWLEEEFTFHPPFLNNFHISTEKILFCEAKEEILWSANQLLKLNLHDVIIILLESIKELDLRRIQLLCKQSGQIVFLLSKNLIQSYSWPIKLQIEVSRSADEKIIPKIFKGTAWASER